MRTAIDEIGDEFLGAEVMGSQGGWNVLCKLFDNLGPIPHHLHQTAEFARAVGRNPKPEAYYYPPQLNFHENHFPYTFMGLEPGTTRDDVRRCLERWNEGDNGILYHSKAYKLKPGTGWQIDPGILHAPGTLVTYEPQVNSDVFAVFQSMVDGYAMPWSLLVKDVPPEHHHDLDYILSMIDWEKNLDPEFARNRHFTPRPVDDEAGMREAGYVEQWVTWSTRNYSAKELTVLPGRAATIRDSAAYAAIVVQGRGRLGRLVTESPALIRYGQMTEDEFFVSAAAAQHGIVIENTSRTENLVLLKHFGPDNPDAAGLVGKKPYEA